MQFLNDLSAIVRDFGHTVVLPHYMTYEWGNSAIKPEIMMRRAFEVLSSSDILIAFPEKSKGVNVLIGWASMQKKKIIILVPESERTSVVHEGMNALTETRIIKFKDWKDLDTKLRSTLEEIAKESNTS